MDPEHPSVTCNLPSETPHPQHLGRCLDPWGDYSWENTDYVWPPSAPSGAGGTALLTAMAGRAIRERHVSPLVLANLPGAYRRGGHDTEMAAALRLQSGTMRYRVLGCLVSAGTDGCTDWEMAAELGELRGSVSKRRGECVEFGWTTSTAERRRTDTGNQAIVWQVTDAGIKEFRLAEIHPPG